MRVILTLQRAPGSAAALQPAVELARALDAPLAALFVEDPALLAGAALPVTRELDLGLAQPRALSAAGLDQSWRREARLAEAALAAAAGREAVRFTFRVVRERHGAAVRAEAEAGDLVLPDLFTRGANWGGAAAVSSPAAPVAAYCATSLMPERVLQVAVRLCQASGRPLALASPPGEAARVRHLAREHGAQAGPLWLPEAGVAGFLHVAAQRGASVCVMAARHASDAPLAVRIRAGLGSTLLALVH